MRRSKSEFLCASMGSLYLAYILNYFMGASDSGISGSMATAIVTPHILCCMLGVVFSWLAFFGNRRGFALAAAIMFCVAAVVFVMYSTLMVPLIILGFVGYARIGTILQDDWRSLS